MPVLSHLRTSRPGKPYEPLLILVFAASGCVYFGAALHAQGAEQAAAQNQLTEQAKLDAAALPDSPGAPLQAQKGSITGVVTDRSGALVSGCRIVLTVYGSPVEHTTTSAEDGSFNLQNVPAGSFTLHVSREGYTEHTGTGTLQANEALDLPQVVLDIAGSTDEVQVYASTHEIAAAQVKLEEKQRVLGIFPNFYISYIPHPVALSKGQKFQLAARSIVDPVNLALTGVAAGVEQAVDAFPGYGQGASGFGKRYGAGFADGAISTTLGGAILPSLLHQDPRYFWKGEGTKLQRAKYAMSRILICKGDNGRWQFNYSSIFGNLASAGLSNLYYPESDRHGAGLTVSNALIGTASGALANLYQEFFSRRMTPSASKLPLPTGGQ